MSNGARQIVMSAIESINYSEELEPVLENNWIPYQIEKQAVICPFDFNGKIIKVQWFVWGAYQEVNRGVIPPELRTICEVIRNKILIEIKRNQLINSNNREAKKVVNRCAWEYLQS